MFFLSICRPSVSHRCRHRYCLRHFSFCGRMITTHSTNVQTTFYYHEETKHHLGRYARGPSFMDWNSQPNPFRTYLGAKKIKLLLPEYYGIDSFPKCTYEQLYQSGTVSPQPLNASTISHFCYYSAALSAWKQYKDSKWSLRVNPSSGNLHPTELYLFLPSFTSPTVTMTASSSSSSRQRGTGDSSSTGSVWPAGLYHYLPETHSLELRCLYTDTIWNVLSNELPPGSFLLGITSIPWRESWKYGERAWRYCQHDCGHLLAALALSSSLLGWKLYACLFNNDDILSQALGLNRPGEFYEEEREECDLLAVVSPFSSDGRVCSKLRNFQLTPEMMSSLEKAQWQGKSNLLSPYHQSWPIISQICEATRIRDQSLVATHCSHNLFPVWQTSHEKLRSFLSEYVNVHSENNRSTNETPSPYKLTDARQIIRQRRSALDFDGRTSIPKSTFFAMLQRVMPFRWAPTSTNSTPNAPMQFQFTSQSPFDSVPWSPFIHLLLFVHRVDGLLPGLYILVRDPCKLDIIRDKLRKPTKGDFYFSWEKVCTPQQLPLYCLVHDDVREVARIVSCLQEIAADGVFSFGMMAEFEEPIKRYGPHIYRYLFWEAGMLGQVMYLEAEAVGIRATGIGCYFDDEVHKLFGITDRTFQSMYHFTVGNPVEGECVRHSAG
jgi:nitroreductase